MGTPFDGSLIRDNYGFVYNITNLTNQRQYIGRKYFWQHRTPKGKKRKVKSESDWKKYYGSCPELKKTLNCWVDKTLVELSYLYIKQEAKQTTKKQNNSLSMESLQSPLTQEFPNTIIPISSADTLEKTTMETDVVMQARNWAMTNVLILWTVMIVLNKFMIDLL